jgi:predicted nuclease of predicted toxin-antitoxin system
LIRILLDEHVSPSLVGKLGDKGVFAVAAAHVGLSGERDRKIWNYALENNFVVVTGNARDFIRLLNVEVHPGLIVLREGGLTRDEQWDRIQPVIEHALESSDDNFLINKLVEISGVDDWEIREIPRP